MIWMPSHSKYFIEPTHYQTPLRRLGSWGRRGGGSFCLLLEAPCVVEHPVSEVCLNALKQDLRVDDPRATEQTVEMTLIGAYAHSMEPLGDCIYPMFLEGKYGLLRDRIHCEPACHHFLLVQDTSGLQWTTSLFASRLTGYDYA
jgi:hypothetical protein